MNNLLIIAVVAGGSVAGILFLFSRNRALTEKMKKTLAEKDVVTRRAVNLVELQANQQKTRKESNDAKTALAKTADGDLLARANSLFP